MKKCKYCDNIMREEDYHCIARYNIRKFCSIKCFYNWKKGKHNDGTIIKLNKICLHCKEKYYSNDYNFNKSKFCSRRCHFDWRIGKSYEDMFGIIESDKIKKRLSIKRKLLFSNNGYNLSFLNGRDKHINSRKGKTFEEIFGYKKSKEIKRKISRTVSLYLSGMTFEERFGIKKAKIIKKKMSDNWHSNSDIYIKKILKGLLKRPTSFEQRFISLIKKYNLPYKYVGDGELIIAGKNPDFININGKKIIIETYHYYDARKNYEKERYSFFKRFGFHTIFLKDNDLFCDNWEQHCLKRINGGG